MNKDREIKITRRQFNLIAGAFGLTSTLLGWSFLSRAGGLFSPEALAATAEHEQKRRYKGKARFNLTFGAAHFTREGLNILPNGSLPFIADLEERTDGEVRIEFIGGNKLCRELECTKMGISGEIDIFSASTQNASAAAPYFNVLDFAYLWPCRAAQYYFFYHPESEKLFREPLRKYHKIQFLFTHCELRSIMLGQKYRDRSNVVTLNELKDAKLRVTGTQLGRITLKLLGTRPVPIPWSDTLAALRTGVIDGAETWSSAVPYGDWGELISHDVHINFMGGNAQSSMNLKTFGNLGSKLQNDVMESAYLTQINIQKTSEAKLVTVTGITDPPLQGSYYAKYGVKNCYWPESELKKAERLSSPRYNPDPWVKWRKRLNRMAGDVDIFEKLYSLARELPADTVALDVAPRRWWKG